MTHPTAAPSSHVALVTGATRGLGRALALALARRGCHVLATGRSADQLAALRAAAAGEALSLEAVQADHTSREDNRKLRQRIAALGGLSILIHNAGLLGPRVAIADYPTHAWDEVMAINLTAPFQLTRELIPLLQAGASVQLVSSGVGVEGRAGWGAYTVSKFGVESLGQVLAAELADRGIRVNVIDPGGMRTSMRAAAYPEEDPSTLITPEENTGVFLWLAFEAGMERSGERFRARDWRAANPA